MPNDSLKGIWKFGGKEFRTTTQSHTMNKLFVMWKDSRLVEGLLGSVKALWHE
jgi:hypothetical protein